MNFFEIKILKTLYGLIGCRALDIFFSNITMLGNGGIIWIAITIVLLIFPKTRKCGFCTAISLIMCLIAGNIVLKPLVARVRPFDIDAALNIIVSKPTDFSFPSGHTLSSFAASSAIYKINRRMGTAALVFAGLIAFSRLYLCLHYPTDVLSGIILGIIFGNTSVIIYDKLISKGKLHEI